MSAAHLDRVRTFTLKSVEAEMAYLGWGDEIRQRLEEELVLDAWRTGYYFDRKVDFTVRHGSDPASWPPKHCVELHLTALGLALPSLPEED